MCGLVGIISSTVLTQQNIIQFKKLLVMDQIRGKDSVGIISEKPTAIEFEKSVIDPVSFLEHRRVGPLLTGTRALVGHNRAATKGGVSVNNAHPFHHDGVTLVHNGTLYTNAVTTPHFVVDSESICYALSRAEPSQATSVLENLDGAYALIWYDQRDNSWNFCRNEDRPLHIMRSSTGNTIWLSSEQGILFASVNEDMDIVPKDHIAEIPAGKLYKITVTGNALVEEVQNFTPKKKYTVTVTTGGNTTTHKNSRHDIYAGTKDAKAAFNKYIGQAGWYKVEIDRIFPQTMNSTLGTVSGWMLDDPYCKVNCFNVPIFGLKMDDVIEVYLDQLYMDRYDNRAADKNPSMATLTGYSIRRPKEQDTIDVVQCVECGGVFEPLAETCELSNGEHLCRSCYGQDAVTQNYAHYIGIKRDFKYVS